jgi:C4-type Zn-finger protein
MWGVLDARRECPMCGETMRLTERMQVDHIPGTGEVQRRELAEWICPECDYFEEADPDDTVPETGRR